MSVSRIAEARKAVTELKGGIIVMMIAVLAGGLLAPDHYKPMAVAGFVASMYFLHVARAMSQVVSAVEAHHGAVESGHAEGS